MVIRILTVSNLNSYIKKSFDNDVILNNVYVKGEISNFKVHSSGHIYFAVKDKSSKLNCVMFREYAEQLKFLPKEGDKVVLKGHISIYEKEGTYQLYAREMELEGIGELYYEFNALKEKLNKAGIFNEDKKIEIPKYPKCIGIVTSPTSAAIRDVINVAIRRNPKIKLLIYPSLVQGNDAPENIIKGINYLNGVKEVDTIILARGGGSIEELWAFNDENLAYAIYNSKKPIISGVGHEIDFTIADFVSDRRAPTPSSAAELAIPLYSDIVERFINLQSMIFNNMDNTLKEEVNRLKHSISILNFNNPKNYIVHQYEYIQSMESKLKYIMKLNLNNYSEQLKRLKSLVDANNPYNIVNKGYALIQDEHNNIISTIKQIKDSDNIYVTLKDGKVKVKITVMEE